MSKREVSEGERELWQVVTRDVRRSRRRRMPAPDAELPKTVRARPSEAPGPERAKAFVPTPRPVHQPPLPKAPIGLDGSTVERLRRGKVEPEGKLDLHGLTQTQAHDRLVTFIRRSREGGKRCVLVVTGKGSPATSRRADAAHHVHDERQGSGILKSMVPRWLQEGDVRLHVSGVHTAHQRHGGGGALYVYLRRRRAD